jgi:BirA family transcriptional regulator, biotin operon repressor / biotin---[acetyl-CoA-carboxylase] ligase
LYKILANTLFLGKEIIYMPSCHSTNDIAMQLIKKADTQEGTIVLTDDQTQGRGQRGNQWVSEAGSNLIMSVILKPKFLRAQDQFALNILASLSVKEAINHFIPESSVKVKWPNDVLINDKKSTGILIENSIQGNSISHSVIGIGVNVNQEKMDFEKATSMFLQAGQKFDMNDFLEILIIRMEQNYLQLKNGAYYQLKSKYLQHLFGYRVERNYRSEYLFKGQIEDVDDNGRLLIRTSNALKLFDFKEVEFIY